MMQKILSLSFVIIGYLVSNAQTFTLYQTDFENPSDAWNNSNTTGQNNWTLRDCAGNGPSFPGSKAQYITKGGVNEDCGVNGLYQYAYANSTDPTGSAITQLEINALCTGSMVATFDYKTEGLIGEDFLELVYSIDGGLNFTAIGAPLAISSNWTTNSISLPPLLNNSIFRIGFRFIFNSTSVNGNPPAIDNFRITGTDNTPPVINFCGSNLNLELNANCEALVNDVTGSVLATDNCSSVAELIINQSPVPGAITLTAHGQSQLITVTVNDQAGNSTQCTLTATAVDQTSPSIICPPSLPPYFLNDDCEVAVPDLTSLIDWSDNCITSAANMIFSQLPTAGDLVSTDQTIVFTISDPYGNSAQCTAQMDVVDNSPPVLTCPTNQSISTGSACFIFLDNYLDQVVVDENCFFGTEVILAQDPLPGNLTPSSTLVTITGTDEAGNSGTCTFNVTPVEDIPPTIVCPENQTISTNVGCIYDLQDLTGDVLVTDNCSVLLNISLSQTPLAGTDLAIGAHLISIDGTDEAGNTASCSFTLNVSDLNDPVIICPGNQVIPVDVNCAGALGTYTGLAAVSDDCSITSSISVVQSVPEGTFINENTQIILTATDQAGNSSTCNFFALTIDSSDPVVDCPSSLSIPINSSCQLVVPDLSGQINVSDNCSVVGDLTFSQNPSSGSLELGLTAVLMTLTDEQGNQETCVTLLIPDDSETPVITCPGAQTIDNGVICDYVLPNYGISTLVLDNCSDFTITQTPSPGSVVQAGTNIIEMEVSDVAGNVANCSFSLNVIENTAPTITCPNNISTCDPVVTYSNPLVADNCSATLTQIDASGFSSGDLFPVGTTIQEYLAVDPSGNINACSFTVTVLDYPAQATIIEDTIELCEATSTVVNAQPHSTGSGEWTVTQGTGNFNNQFASTTGVNNLTYGTNILVYTISTASCGSTNDSVYVIASQSPLPASTQDSLNACNSPSINLISNTPLFGIGEWSTDDPSTVIVDVNSSNTSASNMTAGYHNYIWTITNGSCPSTSDTLIVYVPAQANIDQSDTAFCLEDGEFFLSATPPAPVQTSSWTLLQGSGNFDSPANPATLVSQLDLGNNMIIYIMEHPNCSSTYDTITIVASLCDGFDPIFPTVITPNLDGKNDLFVINFLEKVYPECRVTIFNRWGSVIFESVGYEEPWDGTYQGESLPMGTYFYRIELNDDEDTVYDGPISIIK